MKITVKKQSTLNQIIGILSLLILPLIIGLSSCEKDTTDNIEFKEQVDKNKKQANETNDKICSTCFSTFKCEIPCKGGGFTITVYEFPNGNVKYTYEPNRYIYVDQAYHNSNWATHTSNIYTFDMFMLINTRTGSNVPWKDEDGNVIVGNVYRYKVKKERFPCSETYSTEMLSGVSDPCDINDALIHLNNSTNQPDTCATGWFGNGIYCPVPPEVSFTPLVHSKPVVVPVIIYIYGKLCLPNPGICGPDTSSTPLTNWNPNRGPVIFFPGQNPNELELHFLRDLKSSQLIIDQPGEIILTQEVKDYYNLPANATLQYGTYPVTPTGFDYSYVTIPIN